MVSCIQILTVFHYFRNVDGLRACIKKGGLGFLDHEKPDVICLQEIKCSKDKLPDEVKVRAVKQFANDRYSGDLNNKLVWYSNGQKYFAS